jgi:predicted phage terminase large subunit-like protein
LLIESQWFQDRWHDKFQLRADQNRKGRYDNTEGGFRLATHVGGATGERGTIRILDDPHDMKKVQSDTVRQSDLAWLRMTWPTREGGVKPAHVVIMQRLHEQDASAYYLEDDDFEHVMLPMRFEEKRRCHTMLGSIDQRYEGQLLFPELFDEGRVKKLERKLGSYDAAGQLQQNPAPSTGGIFKRHNWRFWYPANIEPPVPVVYKDENDDFVTCHQIPLPTLSAQLQSWDMTFKSKADSSYVVGQVWGHTNADCFLLHQVRERLELPQTIAALENLTESYPQAFAKLIEDKANGPAVMQTLQQKIQGMLPVNPQGDKVARARAVTPLIEAGNVYLPHPKVYEWVDEMISRFTSFPRTDYDDEIDAASQALNYLGVQLAGGHGSNKPPEKSASRWATGQSRRRGSRWR